MVEETNKDKKIDEAVIFSKKPTNSEEATAWVHDMIRNQLNIWVAEGKKCAQCGKEFKSIKEFETRNPKIGNYPEIVDADCWEEYAKTHKRKEDEQKES